MRFALILAAATLFAQAPTPVPAIRITPEERQTIEQKTGELDAALRPLRGKVADDLLIDAEVYLKAARWIVRYDEFYSKAYVAQTLYVLDAGLERAKELAAGQPTWPRRTGSFVRAYRSRVDGSVQPYALTVPDNIQPGTPEWLEVNLHGRGATLNEVSFIYSHDHAKPAPADHEVVKLDVFGRANVAYRWAGETEVFEAIESVRKRYNIDPARIALRGFSMGGGGAWHLGLHFPDQWAVVEAGAGFVETKVHGKVENPPIYATIYDVMNSALNAVNTPTVGYGGQDDPQLRASVFVREQLQREGYHFEADGLNFRATDLNAIFLVGPHTQHKWHPDSKKVSDAFVLQNQSHGIKSPAALRFVTYTERYNHCFWVTVDQLEQDYERAQVDARQADNSNVDVTTRNVARLTLRGEKPMLAFVIDGQSFPIKDSETFEKTGGKWRVASHNRVLEKSHGLQGPIDDAFRDAFLCVKPADTAVQSAVNDFALKELDRFSRDFPRYMRGDVPVKTAAQVTPADQNSESIVAFGTPATNPLIARAVKTTPIHWTAKSITVGGREFDAATHMLSMIYPNPDNPKRYMVLNSGHTFHEADFKGTNVLLYPRIGDWAVTDVTTGKVVAEGVFDRNWKLP
jgi:pimeloyl-ACP methyl ester carboxylesterase